MTRDEMIAYLRREQSHYECEDCWYSCAKLTCDDRRKDDECDCGADEKNKANREIADALAAQPEVATKELSKAEIDRLINGPPGPIQVVYPLDEEWNEALEAAARTIERQCDETPYLHPNGQEAIDAIRRLKRHRPQEGSTNK